MKNLNSEQVLSSTFRGKKAANDLKKQAKISVLGYLRIQYIPSYSSIVIYIVYYIMLYDVILYNNHFL